MYCKKENTLEGLRKTVLITSIILMLTTYAVLLGFIVHNTAKYVILQKRYALHIVYFYIVAIYIVVLRIVVFSCILYFLIHKAPEDETNSLTQLSNTVFVFDNLSTYGSIILGIQWLCSINELSTMIRLSDLIQ